MSKVYLKIPTKEELKFRQEWLKDLDTMSYNAGYDIELKGYDYNTGTITKTDSELKAWFASWCEDKKNRYFAYIIDNEKNIPVGEIHFSYQEQYDAHCMGILIESKYRGNGYSYDALKELEKIAFNSYNVKILSDFIPLDRNYAIRTFKKAGFIQTNVIKSEMKFNKKEDAIQFIITKEMYEHVKDK